MRRKALTVSTLAAALLIALGRVWLQPAAAVSPVGVNQSGWLLFGSMAGITVLLAIFGRVKTPSEAPIKTPGLGIGGLVFGVVLTGTSLWDLVIWLTRGLAPAPGAVIQNNVDRLALTLTLLSGIVGGVFLCCWSLRRLARKEGLSPAGGVIVGIFGTVAGLFAGFLSFTFWKADVAAASATRLTKATERSLFIGMAVGALLGLIVAVAFVCWMAKRVWNTEWLWLLPTLWMFARLVRYDVCYALAVNIAPAIYEFLMCGVGLLFLLALAKQMSGVMKPSRWLRGFAAAAAALSLSAPAARLVLTYTDPAAAAYCPIPGVVDAVFALFALSVVLLPDKAVYADEAPAEE